MKNPAAARSKAPFDQRAAAAPAQRIPAAAQPLAPAAANAAAPAASDQRATLARARAFAQALIADETLACGENRLAHADAVAAILKTMGGSELLQAAIYLVHACSQLNKPEEVIAKNFGAQLAALAVEARQLMRVQQQARAAEHLDDPAVQTENLRKMLLAFSRDLRVVLLLLASRLQLLRYCASARQPVPPGVARESLQVFASLAHRLGIWQIKWELEDLAFRFLEPDSYKQIARLLDAKRGEREAYIEQLRARLQAALSARAIPASVQGRPKHIYSIVRKMRGKALDFDQVLDIRALRVVIPGSGAGAQPPAHKEKERGAEPQSKKSADEADKAAVQNCYAALSLVHELFRPIVEEFDDYIARPKPNGYRSLHTVVRDTDGRPIEIQIRTQTMHEHAEYGVAAHWAYKEAGTRGYAGGVAASGDYEARVATLRHLLAWERELSGALAQRGPFGDRIYVLTPEAAVIDLPQGATPVDFAYAVHTSVGHRCRGAKIDGVLVPLNTALQNGQMVEISTAKEGRPSRDWLNADLGYLASPRARAKVRAWFNAQATHETIARGREAVEKLLQREGKNAFKLDELAAQLGFKSADALFEVVGKDEFSLRNIETLLRPPPPPDADAGELALRKTRSSDLAPKGSVLVVGLDSLMTQLAKCCKPAPPDAIGGFVTRGKGVSVHRASCSNFRELAARSSERVIEVQWSADPASASAAGPKSAAAYPVDVAVQASDRQGLLRDISEVFAHEKTNVTGVQTQSVKGTAWMTFTVEVSDATRLNKVLELICAVPGVRRARRR